MKEKKKMSLNESNFWVNLILFAAFFIVSAPQSTGIPLHEWLSFVFAVPIIWHLILHWDWIVKVGQRFLKRVPGETRFNYIWDIVLFIMMAVVFFTGVLVSEVALPVMGIPLEIDPFWSALHNTTANLLLVMMAIHLAVHWDWIVNAFKRYLLRKSTNKPVSKSA